MDEKLLYKYIFEKVNKRERREVVEWLRQDQENINQYSEMKAKYVFNGFSDEVLPERKPIFPVISRIAACLFIPLLAGAIYLFVAKIDSDRKFLEADRRSEFLLSQNKGSVTYVANPGTKSVVVLPDSSVVHLNSDSKLIVPSRFDSDSREVSLSGEGYFEIVHHEDWPMYVHTPNGVTVTVLGTTFDLSAYEDDDNLKLTLVEGKVILREDYIKKEHIVRPNQEIFIPKRLSKATAPIIDKKAVSPVQQSVIQTADVKKNTAWINGELVFDNAPMSEIIKKLERWYGVDIHVNDEKIMKYSLTATFTTESITKVMELIKFSSMIDYTIRGNQIYLRQLI